MAQYKIGFLHPGSMGISLVASAQNSGHDAYWTSEGRSRQTRDRAEQFHLHESSTLAQFCETCPILVSVCPPHAAESVAELVLQNGFHGIYLI